MRRAFSVFFVVLCLVLAPSFATVASAQREGGRDDYAASNSLHLFAVIAGPLGLIVATAPAWANPCSSTSGFRICEASVAMNLAGLGLEVLSIALGVAATVMHCEVRARRDRRRGDLQLTPWVRGDAGGLSGRVSW